MRFIKVTNPMSLSQLTDIVGSYNVDSVLAINGLLQPNGQRPVDVYGAYATLCDNVVDSYGSVNVSNQKKATLLNGLSSSYDAFETVALGTEDDWKVYDALGTINGYIRIPDTMTKFPNFAGMIGGGEEVSQLAYRLTMSDLANNRAVNPTNFTEVSKANPSVISETARIRNNPIETFAVLPWGKITLVSEIDERRMDIPAYPEQYRDGRKATYTTMPDVLYQYEPWYVYTHSGERANNFSFHLHRDMWSGDHRDGNANRLIRFCESLCYPRYNGSAVNTSTVSLYVNGKCLISGIMNDVSVEWSEPIGLDGWYLDFTLTLTITEVSKFPLSFDTVRNIGLIG